MEHSQGSAVEWEGAGTRRARLSPRDRPAPPRLSPRDRPERVRAWPHLHAVGLVAHGHGRACHVTHAAGLRGLGEGREALRRLGGHALRREGVWPLGTSLGPGGGGGVQPQPPT